MPISPGGDGKAGRHLDAVSRKVADQFSERGILAADESHVATREVLEPANVFCRRFSLHVDLEDCLMPCDKSLLYSRIYKACRLYYGNGDGGSTRGHKVARQRGRWVRASRGAYRTRRGTTLVGIISRADLLRALVQSLHKTSVLSKQDADIRARMTALERESWLHRTRP